MHLYFVYCFLTGFYLLMFVIVVITFVFEFITFVLDGGLNYGELL